MDLALANQCSRPLLKLNLGSSSMSCVYNILCEDFSVIKAILMSLWALREALVILEVSILQHKHASYVV